MQQRSNIIGTIHLRRRHVLGGEGSKIGQICWRIVVKNCRWRGVGVKNSENLPTSLMDGPLKAEWNAAAMQCFYCFNMLLRGKRIFFCRFQNVKRSSFKGCSNLWSVKVITFHMSLFYIRQVNILHGLDHPYNNRFSVFFFYYCTYPSTYNTSFGLNWIGRCRLTQYTRIHSLYTNAIKRRYGYSTLFDQLGN